MIVAAPGRMERWLRRRFSHQEIGWEEIGEQFTRYTLFKCRWFQIFIHQLYVLQWHPECHDHPWGFLTLLLSGGYLEQIDQKNYRRRPGMIMYRPATFLHNVITPYGTSWSILLIGPKKRQWGFKTCQA